MNSDPQPQPPQDIAAEQAVLGAVLLSPAALGTVAEMLSVEEFYRPAHQVIYGRVLELYAGGEPTDVVTLAARLDAQGELLRVGGAPYLHTLISGVPTAANASYYAEIVTAKAVLRRLVEAGRRIVQLGYHGDDGADVDEVVDLAQATVQSITERPNGVDGVIGLDEAIDEAFERLAGPVPPTIPTGLHDLDDLLTGGLRNGAVYIIAARPGCGKSLCGSGIGLSVAQHGAGVLICSLEMSREEITNRILANLSAVELSAITTHHLNDFDWAHLRKARDQYRGIPLLIRDTPHLTSTGLRRLAERLARKPAGLGLIVVDYAQQMTPTNPTATREQQVAEISRSAKRLAMHLGVAVILLAQTNRKSTERPTPDTVDLRESGSLESDADVVIILRLPTEPERAGEIDAHVVKNRHGRTGVIPLAWSPHYARIRSLLREAS